MIKITFPDNSVKEFEAGTTPLQIANSISPRLGREVLAASVNGNEWDLSRPIDTDASIKLFKWEDPEGKHAFWHSSAHLLAEALQELYPGVRFGIGPAIENGFYYDIDPGENKLSSDDFAKIEAKMLELARKDEAIVRKDIAKADALDMFGNRNEEYKCELISELEDGHITTYTQGAFTDLCRGPHLPSTGAIKGPITADVVRIAGTVEGNITALDHLQLERTGTINGDVTTVSFVIENGGRLNGRTTMVPEQASTPHVENLEPLRSEEQDEADS